MAVAARGPEAGGPEALARALRGILKGAAIGVTSGVWGYTLELHAAWALYLLYGVVGALSGLLCGRPPWRHANAIPPVAKVIFAVGVCLGLAWITALANGGFGTPSDRPLVALPEIFAPLLALLCGILLEVDDGEDPGATARR